MRESSCLKAKPLRKEASIMSTIESLDDGTFAKEDFSVCGTHWSASDKSNSKRSSCNLDGKGTYSNPYGTDHAATGKNESTTESLMRVLRQSGVTRLINDICCDSVSLGINEPDSHDLSVKSNENFNFNDAMLLRNSGKYAHECESVDTQDSLIRRQSLMNGNNRAPNPIHILEVQHKRKPRTATRSQTAPRQRGEQNAFNMVAPYSTLTPRAGEVASSGMGTEDGVMYRKFSSNGNLTEMDKVGNHDAESISSRSTLTRRSKESFRSRERQSFSTTRFSMSSKKEDISLPPRKAGKQRSSGAPRSLSKPKK